VLAAIHAEGVDHAARAVGDEELLGGGIEGEAAEAGAGIGLAVEAHIGEEARLPGAAVDPPDRARSAALLRRSEQARHEGGAGAALAQPRAVLPDDRQSIGRGRREIDVGWIGVVERDAEHLADLPGGDGAGLLRIDELAAGRPAEILQRDDPCGRTIEVDRQAVGTTLPRPDAGEAGDHGIARRHDALGLRYGGRRCGCRREEDAEDGAKAANGTRSHHDFPPEAGGA
jgi:hypothetical protein